MVLCPSPIPALDAERSVDFTGSPERHGRCSSQFANDRQYVIRAHHCAAGAKGTKKRPGRSKGGLTTPSLHQCAKTIAAEIGGGQESDYKGYLPVGSCGLPESLARTGDMMPMRSGVWKADGVALEKCRKVLTVDDHIYALRNMVERCINKMKNARRLATRYDKTASSYFGFVHLVSIRLWIKHFVNRT